MMTYFVIAIMSAFSLPALACPNLSGDYNCESSVPNQTFQFSVKQENVKGVTHFQMGEPYDMETYIADGVPRRKDFLDVLVETNSCENNTLIVHRVYWGFNKNVNPEVIKSVSIERFYKTENGALAFDNNSYLIDEAGNVVDPYENKGLCTQ